MPFQSELRRRLAGLVVLDAADSLEPAEYAEVDELGRRKAKGEQGLGRYFREVAPDGYVQLRHGDGLISDGLTDTGLINVEAIAPTLALANALADTVRKRVGSVPVQPTRFTFQTRQVFEEPDYARVLLTFQTRDIGV